MTDKELHNTYSHLRTELTKGITDKDYQKALLRLLMYFELQGVEPKDALKKITEALEAL